MMKWTYIFLAILSVFLLVSCTPEETVPVGPPSENETQDDNETLPQPPQSEKQPEKTEFVVNCKIQQDNLCAAQAQTTEGWTLGTIPFELAQQLVDGDTGDETAFEVSSEELSKEQISSFSERIASYVYNSSNKVLSLAEDEYGEEYNVVKVVPQHAQEEWVWQVSFFQEDLEEPDEVILVNFKADEIVD